MPGVRVRVWRGDVLALRRAMDGAARRDARVQAIRQVEDDERPRDHRPPGVPRVPGPRQDAQVPHVLQVRGEDPWLLAHAVHRLRYLVVLELPVRVQQLPVQRSGAGPARQGGRETRQAQGQAPEEEGHSARHQGEGGRRGRPGRQGQRGGGARGPVQGHPQAQASTQEEARAHQGQKGGGGGEAGPGADRGPQVTHDEPLKKI
eukprot:TRINITY_DN5357_c0_g2_i1.p3 TRINITY_DN5357_c0_g2~~TRINITY_DN5357_c0_g2_i1.p3  ORF type:complete len:204 (-),score=6.81 TRINITY_DN5357_c0_g2_i1:54-665(-)